MEILILIRQTIHHLDREIQFFVAGMGYGLGPYDIEGLRVTVFRLRRIEREVRECLHEYGKDRPERRKGSPGGSPGV